MNSKVKVTYRQIAKFLSKGLPIQGPEFSERISEVTQAIKRMPKAEKQALQCAYIFAQKVPRQEREDLFQELALAVLENQSEDMRLSYAICRCDWLNWWSRYRTKQHYQLTWNFDDEVSHRVGINPVSLADLVETNQDMRDIVTEVQSEVITKHETGLLANVLIGELDWEQRQCEKLDAKNLWNSLPQRIKGIARNRLMGKAVNPADRKCLSRFVQANPMILVQS